MKKRNKKAQFYLIASIILVALFLSFVSLMNYSIKKNNPEIYKYADELKIEGAKVLDYDINTGQSEFDEFAKSYSYYVGRNREIYFIVGDSGSLDVFNYNEEDKEGVAYTEGGGNVVVNVEGTDFTFELKPGQNFYFVMNDKYKDQEYFVTNAE